MTTMERITKNFGIGACGNALAGISLSIEGVSRAISLAAGLAGLILTIISVLNALDVYRERRDRRRREAAALAVVAAPAARWLGSTPLEDDDD